MICLQQVSLRQISLTTQYIVHAFSMCQFFQLNKMKEVTNALATLAAVSTQSDFNNMYSIVSQMYKVWTRNSGHKITLNVAAPGTGKSQIVNVGVSLGDEEDMDLANGSSKHLKDDDPSLSRVLYKR